MTSTTEILVEKVVKDGMVAVLVSPGYGAGWYTWNLDHPELLFLPPVVELVLAGAGVYDIEDCIRSQYGEGEIYTGGAVDLMVKWVPVGSRFRISEYDGAEALVLESAEQWITA